MMSGAGRRTRRAGSPRRARWAPSYATPRAVHDLLRERRHVARAEREDEIAGADLAEQELDDVGAARQIDHPLRRRDLRQSVDHELARDARDRKLARTVDVRHDHDVRAGQTLTERTPQRPGAR